MGKLVNIIIPIYIFPSAYNGIIPIAMVIDG